MKRIQAFVDIAVNNQFHNVKFENRVKNKKKKILLSKSFLFF